jgi:hypothetical protein
VNDPLAYTVARHDWQFFCTFTFPTRYALRVIEGRTKEVDSAFYATLRRWCKLIGHDFRNLQWVRRMERGGQSGRPHFHALIRGVQPNRANRAGCFILMHSWSHFTSGYDAKDGALSRVRLVRPSDVDRVTSYTTKDDIDPDAYEIGRFDFALVASGAFLAHAKRTAAPVKVC